MAKGKKLEVLDKGIPTAKAGSRRKSGTAGGRKTAAAAPRTACCKTQALRLKF